MLTIEIRPIKGVLFVRLYGILDKFNTFKLNTEVLNFQKQAGIKNIVFNVGELEDIDIYGKKALENSFNLCKKNNGQSFICVSDNKKIIKKLKDVFSKQDLLNDELTALKIINS